MKKFLLALPFLALLLMTAPAAKADDNHRHNRGYSRHQSYQSHRGYSRHEYRHARRHSYYRHGHRYYGYYPESYYNGPSYGRRSAISINLGL